VGGRAYPGQHRVAHAPLHCGTTDLEPVVRALGRLVGGVDFQRLHHEALAVALDGLVEEALDLFNQRSVHRLGERKLAFHLRKVGHQQLPAGLERLPEQRLCSHAPPDNAAESVVSNSVYTSLADAALHAPGR